MAKMNKVCVNIDQSDSANGGFTDAEKAQARQNIGAGTGNSNSTIVHDSNTLPPVTTNVSQMTVFDDGRTRFDNLYRGVIPSEPSQSESGRVLVANYAGSPAKGTAQWKDVHNVGINEVPTDGSNGQVLTWNNNAYNWANAPTELPTVFKDTIADGTASQIINIPVSIYVQPLSLNWSRTLDAYSIIDMNVNMQYRWEDQNATPEYVIQLMNDNTVLDEVLWQVPCDESTFQEPHILGYDLRLIYHNTTSSSINLSLRIKDEGQAPTGVASIDKLYVKGIIWNR